MDDRFKELDKAYAEYTECEFGEAERILDYDDINLYYTTIGEEYEEFQVSYSAIRKEYMFYVSGELKFTEPCDVETFIKDLEEFSTLYYPFSGIHDWAFERLALRD